jgi:hypothetical protein
MTCDRAGKHPAERWKELPADRKPLTPTETQGVGIATGERSGIFVVDLDVKNGVDGASNFFALGDVPPTYTVATPSGGFHLYFKHPGFPVRNSGPKSNPIAPGVDVRGEIGYVVAPGSPHKNGGKYSIAADLPIAEAPAWLLAWPGLKHAGAELAAPATEAEASFARIPKEWRVNKAKAWLEEQKPAIEGDGGDAHTFTLLTRGVHRFGLTDADMIADAFAEWNARCEPPWGGQQWAHKVESALHQSTVGWSKELGTEYAIERMPKRLVEAANAAKQNVGSGVQVPTDTSAGNTLTAGRFIFDISGLDAELPPISYLVDSLIGRGEVVMLVAHGNSLKTWLALSVGLSVASGRPWLGKYLVQRGRVAVLDFESGKYELVRRLKLIGARDADVGDNLLRCSYSEANLTDPEAWVDLAGLGLSLIIVDSFAAADPFSDENDKRSALLLKNAGAFAEATGCTVIVIHHARKGSGGDKRESVRGSTAIFAACDRIFEFSDLEEVGDAVKVTMGPIKPGAGKRPSPVRVSLTDQGLSAVPIEVATEDEESPEDRIRKDILQALTNKPAGVNKTTLLESIRGKKDLKYEVMASLLLSDILVEIYESHQKIVLLNPTAGSTPVPEH